MFEIFGSWLDGLSAPGFVFFLFTFFVGAWGAMVIAFRAMTGAFSALRAQILTRKLLKLRIRIVRLAARRVIIARCKGIDPRDLKEDPWWTQTLRRFWGEYQPLWYSLCRLSVPDPALDLDPDRVSEILGAVEPPSFLLRNAAVSREHSRKLQKHLELGRKLRAWERKIRAWEKDGYNGPRPQSPDCESEVMKLADCGHAVADLVAWFSPSRFDRRYI